MNKNKTYILIDKKGFKGEYSYCPEHKAIFERGKENECCLFDLLYCFIDIDDLDTQLNICQYILMAYETGIKKEKDRIFSKITNFLN